MELKNFIYNNILIKIKSHAIFWFIIIITALAGAGKRELGKLINMCVLCMPKFRNFSKIVVQSKRCLVISIQIIKLSLNSKSLFNIYIT